MSDEAGSKGFVDDALANEDTSFNVTENQIAEKRDDMTWSFEVYVLEIFQNLAKTQLLK